MYRDLRNILAAAVLLPGCAYAADQTDLCAVNYHSQALLIGNQTYQETMAVPYAHNDVAAIRKFLIERLCYRPGNIKTLKDATYNNLRRWLGRANDPQGRLWDLATQGKSNVFVFYSGHGVPNIENGQAYLLPIDADPNRPEDGYGLEMLNRNLSALKVRIGGSRQVTLVIDACFSGLSAAGPLQSHKGSFRPKIPEGSGVLRFSASGPGQLAYWNTKSRLGLFTEVFLEAANGAADRSKRHGDQDGHVTGRELREYIADQVSHRARRLFGRNQTPSLPSAADIVWSLKVDAARPGDDRPGDHSSDIALWKSVENSRNAKMLQAYLDRFPNGLFATVARLKIEALRTPKPDIVRDAIPTERIRLFMDDTYYGRGRLNHPADIKNYGSRVNYYKLGRLSRRAVMAHKRKYFRKWPRRFTSRLEGTPIRVTKGRRPNTFVVVTRFRFEVSNRRKRIGGTGTARLTLADTGDRFLIIGETSRVDKRN